MKQTTKNNHSKQNDMGESNKPNVEQNPPSIFHLMNFKHGQRLSNESTSQDSNYYWGDWKRTWKFADNDH